jgi:hypothetical protein
MSGPVVHNVYGIRIRTPWPIPALPHLTDAAWDVEFVESAAESFEEAARYVAPALRKRLAQHATLPDGSRYRLWANLLEFLVSPDARRVQARAMPEANPQAFQTYLLLDALLFTLVRMGREPLHATAVDTPGGVIAFAGESGLGKSTLGALFVQAGYQLVTDDMLMLVPEGDGFVAHPGPPRLKLYRETADRIFDAGYSGMPMTPTTDKLLIPLGPSRAVQGPRRFHALYLLKPTDDRSAASDPVICRITPSDAVPQIVALTASHWTEERERLERQFRFVIRLVQSAPIKTLSYRRDPDLMPQLRQAIIEDIASDAR